jgi:agmatinase
MRPTATDWKFSASDKRRVVKSASDVALKPVYGSVLASRPLADNVPPVRFDLIGLPTDSNSSFQRGAAGAPANIRTALFSPSSNLWSELGFDIGAQVVDRGDLRLSESASDDAVIEEAVRGSAKEGRVPICLGGDHSVTVAIVRALQSVHGPLNIMHFDAHPDLYDEFEGSRRSHACPFARIMEAGHCARLVQIGVRTMNDHQKEQARRFAVTTLGCIEPQEAPILKGPLYITIDLDGLDPAFAPGVSHQEPGGLSTRDVVRMLHRQRAAIVGIDVVELNPDRDVGGMTAMAAAKLVKEAVAVALRNAAT